MLIAKNIRTSHGMGRGVGFSRRFRFSAFSVFFSSRCCFPLSDSEYRDIGIGLRFFSY